MPLKTRNVFIDTQTFERLQFGFTSSKLRSLREICENDGLTLISTTIVVREVQAHVAANVRAALNHLKDFRRKARILSGDEGLKSLFGEVDETSAVRNAHAILDNFLSDAGALILDPGKLSAAAVLDDYFRQSPPFGEKKKAEFPDAFSLLAIREHLKSEECVYVVSEDKDLAAYCAANPQFIHVDKLEKLLDLYNQHDEQLAAFIRTYLEENEASIKAKIAEQVEVGGAFNSSTWDDSYVTDFRVSRVNDIDPSIVYLDDTTCHIVIDTSAEYTVVVQGPDTANGIWDSEDKRVYSLGETMRTSDGEADVFVELNLTFKSDDETFTLVKEEVVVANAQDGTEVSVEEWDESEY